MGFNKDKVKQRKAELTGGNDFKAKEGETLLFFCDTGHSGDECNYVETIIHYGLGPRRTPVMCLDASRNPALADPRVIELAHTLKNIDLVAEAKKGCPVCRKVWGGDGVVPLPKEEGDEIKASRRYLFPVVPMAYKVADGREFQDLDPRVQVWNTSYTQWDKITDELVEIGNPTDTEHAVFINVKRKGLKKNDTKYDITTDKKSFKEPKKLSKHVKALILKTVKPGELGDIYQTAAELAKTVDEMEALLTGIQVEQQSTQTDDDEHPACFGMDYADEDAECKACDDKVACAKACDEDSKPTTETTKVEAPPAEEKPKPDATATDDKGESSQELDELEDILKKRGAKRKKEG